MALKPPHVNFSPSKLEELQFIDKKCCSCKQIRGKGVLVALFSSTSSEYLLKIQCVNTAWCTENSQIWSVGLGCVSHDFSAAPKSTKFFLFCRIFLQLMVYLWQIF